MTEDGRRVTVNELIVLINAMRRLTVKADLQVMVNGRPAPFDSSPLFLLVVNSFVVENQREAWLVYLDLALPAAFSFHFTPNTHTSCCLGAFLLSHACGAGAGDGYRRGGHRLVD